MLVCHAHIEKCSQLEVNSTSRVYHGRSLVHFLPWKSSLPVYK